MVTAVPTSSPHPPIPSSSQLSPEDFARLQSLFDCGFDIHAFAQKEGLSVQDLLAFTGRPEIKRAMDELLALEQVSLTAAHDRARLVAIKALEHVATASGDLVEKRRAASALMRRLNPAPVACKEPKPKREPEEKPPPRTSEEVAKELIHNFLNADNPRAALKEVFPLLAPGAKVQKAIAPETEEAFLTQYAEGPIAQFKLDIERAEDWRWCLYYSNKNCDQYEIRLVTPGTWHPILWFDLARPKKGKLPWHILRMGRSDRDPVHFPVLPGRPDDPHHCG